MGSRWRHCLGAEACPHSDTLPPRVMVLRCAGARARASRLTRMHPASQPPTVSLRLGELLEDADALRHPLLEVGRHRAADHLGEAVELRGDVGLGLLLLRAPRVVRQQALDLEVVLDELLQAVKVAAA